MKKFVVIAIVLSLMVPLVASEGLAANWFVCNILQAGTSNDGLNWVQLSDSGGAFGATWYSLPAAPLGNPMLATALTAISNQKQVNAFVETIPNTQCTGMLIK